MDWPDYTEEEEKALTMAQELLAYCKKHNFPEDTQLAGVIIFGNNVKKKAYNNGMADQKNIFRNKLGL